MLTIIMPLLAFALLFLELFLLIVISQAIGFAVVFAEIVLTVFAGLALMRFAGRTAFQPAQLIGVFLHGLGSGFSMKKPIQQVLFGSLLLIIPGFVTDILGIVFITRFFLQRGSQPQSSKESASIDVEFDIRDDDQT
ncbi:FxsA family protein [Candidatus Bipolaricaulota bacterium]|nr:FxsA family protein [Candidatus Bipolaricaulota bacterium]